MTPYLYTQSPFKLIYLNIYKFGGARAGGKGMKGWSYHIDGCLISIFLVKFIEQTQVIPLVLLNDFNQLNTSNRALERQIGNE